MRLAHEKVRVRVPATSGNVGPGFDSIGLALDIYDELFFTAVAGPTTVEPSGEGASEVPLDESHLVVRAFHAALEVAGAPRVGVQLRTRNHIPHRRGMGSSAAAVVGGIAAARALIADPDALDNPTALGLATEFEGHPDNAAPALWGGVTVAWDSPQLGPQAVPVVVPAGLEVTVFTPTAELPTAQARAALPPQVPHEDAAFNLSRSALLVTALSQGRADLLAAATEDRLHQGYRASQMPPSIELMETLRAGGYPAVISGAGPTVMALARVPAHLAPSGWRVQTVGLGTGARTQV